MDIEKLRVCPQHVLRRYMNSVMLAMLFISSGAQGAEVETRQVSIAATSWSEEPIDLTGSPEAYVGSSDIELFFDEENGGEQIVALRFDGLLLEADSASAISSAYVQFTATDPSYDDPVSVDILADAAPRPLHLTSSVRDVSNRSTTDASARWNVESWMSSGSAGASERTPDLTTLIHEAATSGDAAWNGGVVLIFRRRDGDPSFATRRAIGTGSPPMLVIDTEITVIPHSISVKLHSHASESVSTGEVSIDDGFENIELTDEDDVALVAMRFPNLLLPQQATVMAASIEFLASSSSPPAETSYFSLRGEAVDGQEGPRHFDAGVAFNLTERRELTATAFWECQPWVADGTYHTPDLSRIIQEAVNDAAWRSGGAVVIKVHHIFGSSRQAVGVALQERGNGSPVLTVEFQSPPCGDDASFIDADGYECRDWEGFRCADAGELVSEMDVVEQVGNEGDALTTTTTTTTVSFHPYSVRDAATLVRRCASSCHLCPPLPAQSPAPEIIDPMAQVFDATRGAEQSVEGDADVIVDSSDYEFLSDLGYAQVVALSFRNLAIPSGTTIVNAAIQFTSEISIPGALRIRIRCERGVGAAGTSPAELGTTGVDGLSSRVRTASHVDWTPADWFEGGQRSPLQRTPNLAVVINEVLGWVQDEDFDFDGNQDAELDDVVFIFSLASDWIPYNIDATRTAVSAFAAAADSNEAPTLTLSTRSLPFWTRKFAFQVSATQVVVESLTDGRIDVYDNSDGGSDDEGEALALTHDGKVGGGSTACALRFEAAGIANGASILAAYVQFTPTEFSPDDFGIDLTIRISAEANVTAASPALPSTVAGQMFEEGITQRSRLPIHVDWAAYPWQEGANTLYRSADIGPLIESLAAQVGWSEDSAVTLLFEPPPASESYRGSSYFGSRFFSSGGGSNAPKFHYQMATVLPSPSSTTSSSASSSSSPSPSVSASPSSSSSTSSSPSSSSSNTPSSSTTVSSSSSQSPSLSMTPSSTTSASCSTSKSPSLSQTTSSTDSASSSSSSSSSPSTSPSVSSSASLSASSSSSPSSSLSASASSSSSTSVSPSLSSSYSSSPTASHSTSVSPSSPPSPSTSREGECENLDCGRTDSFGASCKAYEQIAALVGFDVACSGGTGEHVGGIDSSFDPFTLCCACGGGVSSIQLGEALACTPSNSPTHSFSPSSSPSASVSAGVAVEIISSANTGAPLDLDGTNPFDLSPGDTTNLLSPIFPTGDDHPSFTISACFAARHPTTSPPMPRRAYLFSNNRASGVGGIGGTAAGADGERCLGLWVTDAYISLLYGADAEQAIAVPAEGLLDGDVHAVSFFVTGDRWSGTASSIVAAIDGQIVSVPSRLQLIQGEPVAACTIQGATVVVGGRPPTQNAGSSDVEEDSGEGGGEGGDAGPAIAEAFNFDGHIFGVTFRNVASVDGANVLADANACRSNIVPSPSPSISSSPLPSPSSSSSLSPSVSSAKTASNSLFPTSSSSVTLSNSPSPSPSMEFRIHAATMGEYLDFAVQPAKFGEPFPALDGDEAGIVTGWLTIANPPDQRNNVLEEESYIACDDTIPIELGTPPSTDLKTIVLVDRGACSFETKVENLAVADADVVIVVNDNPALEVAGASGGLRDDLPHVGLVGGGWSSEPKSPGRLLKEMLWASQEPVMVSVGYVFRTSSPTPSSHSTASLSSSPLPSESPSPSTQRVTPTTSQSETQSISPTPSLSPAVPATELGCGGWPSWQSRFGGCDSYDETLCRMLPECNHYYCSTDVGGIDGTTGRLLSYAAYEACPRQCKVDGCYTHSPSSTISITPSESGSITSSVTVTPSMTTSSSPTTTSSASGSMSSSSSLSFSSSSSTSVSPSQTVSPSNSPSPSQSLIPLDHHIVPFGPPIFVSTGSIFRDTTDAGNGQDGEEELVVKPSWPMAANWTVSSCLRVSRSGFLLTNTFAGDSHCLSIYVDGTAVRLFTGVQEDSEVVGPGGSGDDVDHGSSLALGYEDIELNTESRPVGGSWRHVVISATTRGQGSGSTGTQSHEVVLYMDGIRMDAITVQGTLAACDNGKWAVGGVDPGNGRGAIDSDFTGELAALSLHNRPLGETAVVEMYGECFALVTSKTSSSTVSQSHTPSASRSASETTSSSLTNSQSSTASPSISASLSPTASTSASKTGSPSATLTSSPSSSASASSSYSLSSSQSLTPSSSESGSAPLTPSRTSSASVSASNLPSPTSSVTVSASAPRSTTPSASHTATATVSTSVSPSLSATASISASNSASVSGSASVSPSITASVSPRDVLVVVVPAVAAAQTVEGVAAATFVADFNLSIAAAKGEEETGGAGVSVQFPRCGGVGLQTALRFGSAELGKAVADATALAGGILAIDARIIAHNVSVLSVPASTSLSTAENDKGSIVASLFIHAEASACPGALGEALPLHRRRMTTRRIAWNLPTPEGSTIDSGSAITAARIDKAVSPDISSVISEVFQVSSRDEARSSSNTTTVPSSYFGQWRQKDTCGINIFLSGSQSGAGSGCIGVNGDAVSVHLTLLSASSTPLTWTETVSVQTIEEDLFSGMVRASSSDLELGESPNGPQIVAVRFENVFLSDVEQAEGDGGSGGSGIDMVAAVVEFSTDEPGSVAEPPLVLRIRGAVGDTSGIQTANSGHTEEGQYLGRGALSSLELTSASAEWTVPAWPTRGEKWASADITDVLLEMQTKAVSVGSNEGDAEPGSGGAAMSVTLLIEPMAGVLHVGGKRVAEGAGSRGAPVLKVLTVPSQFRG